MKTALPIIIYRSKFLFKIVKAVVFFEISLNSKVIGNPDFGWIVRRA